MSKISFECDSNSEIKKRNKDVQEFLDKVINVEEHPFFISDTATIFDICSDDSPELLLKITESYGIQLQVKQLALRFWELIDLLHKK